MIDSRITIRQFTAFMYRFRKVGAVPENDNFYEIAIAWKSPHESGVSSWPQEEEAYVGTIVDAGGNRGR